MDNRHALVDVDLEETKRLVDRALARWAVELQRAVVEEVTRTLIRLRGRLD